MTVSLHSIPTTISRLVSEFYNLGARYITLTHMGLNQLGDSSNDHNKIPARKYGGLTDFGKAVILEMNRLGMLHDAGWMNSSCNFVSKRW